jgi:hypothetical protein
MKRKRLIMCCLLVFLLAAASCSSKAADSVMTSSRQGVASEMIAMEEPAMAKEAAYDYDDYEAGGAVPSYNVERVVIKNADLSLIVVDPAAALETISRMAEEKGGFVVNSNIYKITSTTGKELPAGYITIRVPAEILEDTMDEIKALVEDADTDILSESVSGQDVTSEVTDLESRLRNLESAESQLLDIMDNATNTEDVMSVFTELTSIREDIEIIQGQLQYYQESAKLSAISINLQAKEAVAPITIGGWRPSLTLQRAAQALIDGLKFVANALIWIVICIAPIALVIGLPIYFIIKSAKKRRMKKKEEKKA